MILLDTHTFVRLLLNSLLDAPPGLLTTVFLLLFYFVVFFFLRSNGPAGNRAKCVAVQKIDGRADGLRKSQTHSYFNYISVKEVSQTDQ